MNYNSGIQNADLGKEKLPFLNSTIILFLIMSSLTLRQNYLLQEGGCKIVKVSCEREGSPAANILSSNQRCLWLIDKPLPQQCIIDTSNLTTCPRIFNRISFHCWHEYESNPALIEVAFSASSRQDWKVVGKIRLQMKSGKQCFRLKDIPSAEMKRLRITILENFGDRCTYLNQVELGFEEDPLVINPVRDKVFSEYVKLTSTERELKKTQEQVARLMTENLSIKQTLLRQGETIIEMQHALKEVTKELQKLQRNQEVQSHPLLVGMHKDDEISSIINRKLQSKLNYATNQSQSQKGGRRYIDSTAVNNRTANHAVNKQSSATHTKNNRSSTHQIKEKEESRHAKAGTVRQSPVLVSKSQSQSDFSADLDYNRSKYSQKCQKMMVTLKSLLLQRQQREVELKKKRQTFKS